MEPEISDTFSNQTAFVSTKIEIEWSHCVCEDAMPFISVTTYVSGKRILLLDRAPVERVVQQR